MTQRQRKPAEGRRRKPTAMSDRPKQREGFAASRERWDWASANDHVLWTIGTSSPERYDLTGRDDAALLASLCPGHRDQTVLEWGCGGGRVTQYLCRLFRHAHAVDISAGMLLLLKSRSLPDVTAHLTAGADLPLDLDPVDVVYSYLCWMHCRKEDVPAILRTCRRVLKPTGRLLFQLPVYDQPRSPETFMDLACWTPREFRALAEETGFTIVRMRASPGAFALDAIGEAHFELHEWRPRPGN